MSESLIIAVLTVIASAISSMSLVSWRLQRLELKVDKHNSFSDRIANIETDIAVIKNDTGYVKKSIEELKNKG